MKVLEVKNLQVNLKTKYGEVKAVRDVSFDLKKGEILSIVGESGSGKSVLCRSILKLLPENGYVKNGDILLNGTNICNLTDKMMSKVRGKEISMIFQDPMTSLNPTISVGKQISEAVRVHNKVTRVTDKMMSKVRGKEISMIFQDPMTSLNPTISVGKQISEAVRVHNKVTRAEAKRRAIELIDFVGIDESESRYNQYPYEFSGGMRQRIAIAIALACNPKILIADEPTTALDSIMQNKILDLIKSIQKKTNISIIFITHDMEVVNKIADRIAVMYAGKIVEIGKKEDIFSNPIHPYTVGLMSSRASFNMDKEYLPTIEGVPPNLLNPPKGDAFDIFSNPIHPYTVGLMSSRASFNMDKEYLPTIEGVPPNLLNPPKGDAFAIRNKNPLVIDFLEEPPMFKVSESHYAATWLLHPNAAIARDEIKAKEEKLIIHE